MEGYRKGPLVWDPKKITKEAESLDRLWTIYENGIYDLTDYYNTVCDHPALAPSSLLRPY